MAIQKTGLQVDTNSNFTNPLIYEENGQVNHIVADNLTPSTRYFARAYVVSDGTTYPSQSYLSFTTLTPSYLSFENRTGVQAVLTLNKYGSPADIVLEYSVDNGETWDQADMAGITDYDFYIEDGEILLLRGTTNTTFSEGPTDYYYFSALQTLYVGGDVRTLVDPTGSIDTIPCDYCFTHLFDGMDLMVVTDLTLQAETLTEGCYSYMFANCSNMGTPMVILAVHPELYCFDNMFFNCGGFDEVTIWVDTYDTDYFTSWLKGCAAQGIVWNFGGAALPTDTDDGIPENWVEYN